MLMDSINNFDRELEDCQAILRYLATYPEVLNEMEISQLLKPEEVFLQYYDWKYLVSQYDGLEKEFFKEYWLPIESDNFQYFIDLSDSKYPIIETIYIKGEGNSEEYISSTLVDSAVDFFLLIENNDECLDYFEKHLMVKYFPSWDEPDDTDLLWQ